jgi:hypothetical protein
MLLISSQPNYLTGRDMSYPLLKSWGELLIFLIIIEKGKSKRVIPEHYLFTRSHNMVLRLRNGILLEMPTMSNEGK